MTNEHFTEQLDLYLMGQLSGEKREAFEQSIQTDPLLKNEFQLQKEISEQLGYQRKLALKQRLQNIDTSTIPAEPNYFWNVVGVGAAVAVVTLAGLVFVNSGGGNNHSGKGSQPEFTQTEKAINSDHAAESAKVQTEFAKTETEAPYSNTPAPSHAFKSGKGSEATVPNVTPPNFGDEPGESNGSLHTASGKNEGDSHKITESPTEGLVEDIEIVKNSSKYTNHYRYVNNKLFLYGNFDKNLYELIELNVSKGKKLYIYNNGTFAQVQPNTPEITAFVPITDPNLVTELNNLKKKKSD